MSADLGTRVLQSRCINCTRMGAALDPPTLTARITAVFKPVTASPFLLPGLAAGGLALFFFTRKKR